MANGLNSSYFLVTDESGQSDAYFSIFVEVNADHSWNYYAAVVLIVLSGTLLLEGFASLILLCSHKKFQTVTNLLVLSNSFIALLLLPFSILMFLAAKDGQWLSGSISCKYSPFSILLSTFILVWVNAFIALDRHRQITSSASPQLRLKSAIVLLVITWIIGSVLLSPYFIVYDVLEIELDNIPYQICSRPSSVLATFLTAFTLTCSIIIPFVVLIVSYRQTFKEIQKNTLQLKKLKTPQPSSTPQRTSTLHGGPITSIAQREKRNKRYKRMVIILVFLVALFITLWLPLAILFVAITIDTNLKTYKLHSYHILLGVIGVLLNGCITPIFYLLTDANIRRYLFRKCSHRKNVTERSLTYA